MSGKLKAINDYLIEKLVEDPRFRVSKNGIIEKQTGVKSNIWKVVGSKDKEGYVRVFYGGNKRVYSHRIVYRKYIGALSEDLVINHKDSNTSNNHVNNLELVPHKKNIEYRDRRKERTGK